MNAVHNPASSDSESLAELVTSEAPNLLPSRKAFASALYAMSARAGTSVIGARGGAAVTASAR